MSEWQPIWMAPKDKEILGWNGAMHIIKWWDSWNLDYHHPDAEKNGGWIIGGGHVINPTLWQHLPDMPERDE